MFTTILAFVGLAAAAVALAKQAQHVGRPSQLADRLADEVGSRVEAKMAEEFEALASLDSLQEQKLALNEEVAKLRAEYSAQNLVVAAEKARREEDFNRREREIEHKMGLLSTQYDADKANDARTNAGLIHEAKLAQKEEALKEKAAAFAEQMKFVTERFTTEIGSTKELLTKIIEAQKTNVMAVSQGADVRLKA